MKSLPERAMKASSGYVFDIKRFATHDGEGIRTTIQGSRRQHAHGARIQRDCIRFCSFSIWKRNVCIVEAVRQQPSMAVFLCRMGE